MQKCDRCSSTFKTKKLVDAHKKSCQKNTNDIDINNADILSVDSVKIPPREKLGRCPILRSLKDKLDFFGKVESKLDEINKLNSKLIENHVTYDSETRHRKITKIKMRFSCMMKIFRMLRSRETREKYTVIMDEVREMNDKLEVLSLELEPNTPLNKRLSKIVDLYFEVIETYESVIEVQESYKDISKVIAEKKAKALEHPERPIQVESHFIDRILLINNWVICTLMEIDAKISLVRGKIDEMIALFDISDVCRMYTKLRLEYFDKRYYDPCLDNIYLNGDGTSNIGIDIMIGTMNFVE